MANKEIPLCLLHSYLSSYSINCSFFSGYQTSLIFIPFAWLLLFSAIILFPFWQPSKFFPPQAHSTCARRSTKCPEGKRIGKIGPEEVQSIFRSPLPSLQFPAINIPPLVLTRFQAPVSLILLSLCCPGPLAFSFPKAYGLQYAQKNVITKSWVLVCCQ